MTPAAMRRRGAELRGDGHESSETPCARCGAPAEKGPYKEAICNRCALELGQAEVAARAAAGGQSSIGAPMTQEPDPIQALEELAAAAKAVHVPACTRLAAAASALARELRQPSEPAAEHTKIIGREVQQLSAAIADAGRVQRGRPPMRRVGAALETATRELGAWVRANPSLSEVQISW